MKTKASLVLMLFFANLSFAISESRYKEICEPKANLSLQGQMICKKHAKNIRPDTVYVAEHPVKPQVAKPVTTKIKKQSTSPSPATKEPLLTSKQRRERLNFKPYIPGGYALTEENNE